MTYYTKHPEPESLVCDACMAVDLDANGFAPEPYYWAPLYSLTVSRCERCGGACDR